MLSEWLHGPSSFARAAASQGTALVTLGALTRSAWHQAISCQSSDDLRRAVERLLERADAVEFFEEAVEELESHPSPNSDEASDER